MTDTTWKEFVYRKIIEYCNRMGSRTFSLQEFYKENELTFELFKPGNHHRLAKIRQQLQFLRNEGLISFFDNSGHYTLRGIDLLDIEKEETNTIDLSKEQPEKKEYIIETYVRNIKWAIKAREFLGNHCLCHNCSNTFLREDGIPYIEVHHIIPLCKGGEDGLWNLSVLCAHHHKIAHYACNQERLKLENFLLQEVKCRIQLHGQKLSL